MSAGPRRPGEKFKAYRNRLAEEERLTRQFLRTGRILYQSTITVQGSPALGQGMTVHSTGPAKRKTDGTYVAWSSEQ